MASFRDRFYTGKVARAITSPLGIVLAGAGTAVGLATGLPVAVAVGMGIVAWGARVAAAIGVTRPSNGIDPYALSEPWRTFVMDARQAERRFADVVKGTRTGPLRDRMGEIGARIDEGLAEAWRIAQRGNEIDKGLASLDTNAARFELSELHRSGRNDASATRTRESLESQLAAADRMARTSADARDRLRLLNARLDEAVARATELSVGAAGDDALSGLTHDVDGLVSELESLRQAMEETARPAGGT